MPAAPKLSDLVVVLVRPRNPLNIGAAARAMSNFGSCRLRLVNPYAIAFREARSAVAALEILENAEEFATLAEAVADCRLVVGTTAVRNRALQHPLRRLDRASGRLIRNHLTSGRVALLFGSEKIGLTNEDFTHCHWLLHVATEEDHISMNLGQSVAVCLYELAQTFGTRTKPTLTKGRVKSATAAETEQISRMLLEALYKSGYVKPGTDAVMQKKVRRLILRLNLEEMDAKVLLGMVRQIVWKLRREDNG